MEFNDEKPLEEELKTSSEEHIGNTSDDEPEQHKRGFQFRRKITWRILYNKFVIVLLIFIVWLTFFDNNNLISRFRVKSELRQLKNQKEYYLKEIEINEGFRDQLINDPEKAEAFGREQYLMKRDNEDIFLIIE